MNSDLLVRNILVWSLQVCAVVLAAGVLLRLLRMHPPGLRLKWLQGALALCLLLPAMGPWHREIMVVGYGDTGGVSTTTGNARVAAHTFDVGETLLAIVLLGAALRLLWMLAGLARLRRYRRNSVALPPTSSWAAKIWSAEADLLECPCITAPVTFGVSQPVILLPPAFRDLDSAKQDAVLCHEILHVRRKDWLWMISEELIRSLLWFHPAIWWLTAEIRLAREVAVDAEVILFTHTKDEYVDALLSFVSAGVGPFSTVAPGFIRRHHLHHRIASILKEVSMSRTRYVSTLVAATTALAAVCWLATHAVPLNAAPQLALDAPGITVDTAGAALLHRTPIADPGIKGNGTVLVQVKLDSRGNTVDATVLSGPEELRRPVLQSVLNWHFEPGAGLNRQISVTFRDRDVQQMRAISPFREDPSNASSFPQRTLLGIEIVGLPESVKQELLATIPARIGEPLTPELSSRVRETVRKVDEHLAIGFMVSGANEAKIVITVPGERLPSAPAFTPPPGALSIAGSVSQTKLINQVAPVYPPLAKAARVQGTVKLDAVIGKDGHVTNIRLAGGPPLLVGAAMEAVRQWVYQPTLLNGNPVEVVTTIDVNFTLAPSTPTVPE